jgi:soluble cytochrome b562
MSDLAMTTDREALKSAIFYMEKALTAFKKGLNLESENEKITTAQKTVEKTKAAPAEAAKKVEAPKKGPEKLAPSIDDIRKVFAKIMLDQVVDGRSIIKSTLDKYNATKVSEFKPEQYLSALTDTIIDYKEDLEKKDPQNADEKLKEMVEWISPF